jgi:membrane-bound inhibitor of C-type lysozyme
MAYARMIAFCVACLVTAACAHRQASSSESTPTTKTDEEIKVRDAFSCENGESIATELDTEARRLTLSMDNGSVVRLPEVRTAAGSRFSDGQTSFWSEGEDAWLELNGTRLQCHRVLSR